MDFVLDRLVDGSTFRCLTVIDTLSREVPGIFAKTNMSGFATVDCLDELKKHTPLPRYLILDNGPKFANHVFMNWCQRNGVSVHFIDPGKPVQNAYIESFNGKFRQEFLAMNRFRDLTSVRSKLKKWIQHYNEERPHSALDYLTPKEFANIETGVIATASA